MGKVKLLIAAAEGAISYVDVFRALGADALQTYCPNVDLNYDGLILFGGGDVDPGYYNEPIDGSVSIDKARDKAEFALLDAYVHAGKPVLGICRGHQVINVYFGGSLYQDIPEALQHKSCTHLVTAVDNSVIKALHGDVLPVNSSHHQVVKVLGEGLRATAYWNDTYVEAMEHVSLPILSVQWHPERMCFEKKQEDTVDGAQLLSYFVRMCDEMRSAHVE